MIDSSPQSPSGQPEDSSFPTLELTERVVLLIDVSRSMSQSDYPPTRLQAAKQAALAFIDKKLGIDESDEVAVAAFAARGRVITKLARVIDSRDSIEKSIRRLKISYSGTQIAHGLRKAASLLEIPVDIKEGDKGGKAAAVIAKVAKKGGANTYVRRIVLLSDGENIGGPDPVETAVRLKQAGVVIDCIGIGERGLATRVGDGLDEKMLMAVASPGRYKYIRDTTALLYHFENLADKVLGEWDSISLESDFKNASIAAERRVSLREPLMKRVRGAARDFVIQLSFGIVPSAILGAFGIRYAFESIGDPGDVAAWYLPWLTAAWVALIAGWVVRLGVYGVRTQSGLYAALLSSVAAYALGIVAFAGAVDDGWRWVSDRPAFHLASLGIMFAAASLSFAFSPQRMLASLKSLPRPWELLLRRRFGFTTLKADSLYIGRQCLNEKNDETVFKAGDRVVFCPVCGQPHHVDCWIWNGGHCYGGDTPCPGNRPVPRRA
jgi:hypothetical protein